MSGNAGDTPSMRYAVAFWWVNQGQTYDEERSGGYLWSPKRAKNGSRRPYYDAMIVAAVNDLVVHYVSKPYGAVISASVVEAPARSEPQPPELRHTNLWNEDGWWLPVVHVEEVQPVSRRDAVALGPSEQPFTRAGTVNQGYLYQISCRLHHACPRPFSMPPRPRSPCCVPCGRTMVWEVVTDPPGSVGP